MRTTISTLLAATASLAVATPATALQGATGQAPSAVSTLDPMIALRPPAVWTPEQRALYDEHVASLPMHWTARQRAAYQQQLSLAPINWTAEQRGLYREHLEHYPAAWTTAQRTRFRAQMRGLTNPWVQRQRLGVGGPTEDYPPCDPGPGDDNCIQLYERGVDALR